MRSTSICSRPRLGTKVRASAVAIGAALLVLPASARAQELTERIRLQGAYLTEQRPAPTPRLEDFFVTAVPELSLAFGGMNSRLTTTYALAAALHSQGGLSEIAHRLTLDSSMELGRRTSLLLSASGALSSVSNLLVSDPASASTVAASTAALYPSAGTQLLTGGVIQGIQHDLTQQLTLTQGVDVTTTSTLPPAPALVSHVFGTSLALERTWQQDALGPEARASYIISKPPAPNPEREYLLLNLGPRWRRDWSRTLSTSISAGASMVPQPIALGPYVRASGLYTFPDDRSIDLSVTTGILPNPLTGQLNRTSQVTLRGGTPISERYRVFGGLSVSYLKAEFIDLETGVNAFQIDSLLTDADLRWQVTDLIQAFFRYQFTAQVGQVASVSGSQPLLRDLVLVGVQMSSRAGDRPASITRFPQRVDGADRPASPGERTNDEAPKGGGIQRGGGVNEESAREREEPPSGPGPRYEGPVQPSESEPTKPSAPAPAKKRPRSK